MRDRDALETAALDTLCDIAADEKREAETRVRAACEILDHLRHAADMDYAKEESRIAREERKEQPWRD
ncbi:MAG TPA: hypothetical protein VG125_13640 [Pirellulales bacterium]|jgi:hypothetical protein|nr:hypothetical protein [Pirellulales bacterium]